METVPVHDLDGKDTFSRLLPAGKKIEVLAHEVGGKVKIICPYLADGKCTVMGESRLDADDKLTVTVECFERHVVQPDCKYQEVEPDEPAEPENNIVKPKTRRGRLLLALTKLLGSPV